MRVPPEVLGKLGLIYADLDRMLADVQGAPAVARPNCRVCGECCTFPEGWPVLYASLVERACLFSEPPRLTRPEGPCPYLVEGEPAFKKNGLRAGKCSARERRTVGCRAFFCAEALPDSAARERCFEAGEEALRRIGSLSKEAGLDWDYAPVIARPPRRASSARAQNERLHEAAARSASWL